MWFRARHKPKKQYYFKFISVKSILHKYRNIPQICEWDKYYRPNKYHKFAFDVVTYVAIKKRTLS